MYKILLISGLICLLSVNVFAQDKILKTQDSCGSASVDAAEAYYNIGRFNECITALQSCLHKKGFNYDEKIQAYRLLSMSYLAIDSVKQGDENIGKLLLLKDNFEADARDPERFRLQVLYTRLQMRAGLISSVSKKNERIELAPATIQIVTAQDIKNKGYQTVEEVFYDLPGFDISRTFGLTYSTLYQRGYRSATATERTLLLVDGVEDNEMWTNSAFISSQFPLSNLKRVEVIYGPASTIYGANAFVGVINIVTKDEDDYFPPTATKQSSKKTSFTVQGNAGVGSLNTRYFDVTTAIRNKDFFFSITGRVFQTDKIDLSGYPNNDDKLNYDTSYYRTIFSSNYTTALFNQYSTLDPTQKYWTVAGSRIVPTTAGVMKGDSLDRAKYNNVAAFPGANNISNPNNNVYLSSKIGLGNFKLGFEYFNRMEGSAPDYMGSYVATNDEYTNWQVRQFNISAKYDKSINEHLNISSFSYYRQSDFGNEAKTTRYLDYANRDYSFADLLNTRIPNYATTLSSQQSNQFRTELRGQYIFNEKFDLVAGGEFRAGIMQADYIRTSAGSPIVFGVAVDSLPGGNNYATYTASAFSQLGYHDRERKLIISLGGRYDYNKFKEIYGYGGIFNPRAAITYYPGKFIFKAIYSEAFLDVSSFNKFSTSATRKLNNPALPPEKVRNVEVSARYTWKNKSNVTLSAYYAAYNNILGSVSVTTSAGVPTTQFQAIGKSHIRGVEIAVEEYIGKKFSLYGNLSIVDPKNITASKVTGADSSVRVGDIANYTFNFGGNIKLLHDKLNINLRSNIVGDKPTGKTTSITSNPLNVIEGYTLFNGAISYAIIKPLTIQFVCNNIFNTYYESPGIRNADGTQFAPFVPQLPRTFFIRFIANITK